MLQVDDFQREGTNYCSCFSIRDLRVSLSRETDPSNLGHASVGLMEVKVE